MDRRPEKTFLQRGNTDGHRHMKRCSTWLIIREIQREHLYIIVAVIWYSHQHWKSVCRFLKKLELLNNPAIPLLGIYRTKTKALIGKDTCTPMSYQHC